MWAWVRTTTSSVAVTTARVAAMPARRTGSAASVHPVNGSRRSRLDDLVEIGAGVEQAAEGHVAGDARRSSGTRRCSCPVDASRAHGSMRATADAAPKPLSIPTTVRPAAHEACMASSAVTPSSAAP